LRHDFAPFAQVHNYLVGGGCINTPANQSRDDYGIGAASSQEFDGKLNVGW